jgi:hypothetical protein
VKIPINPVGPGGLPPDAAATKSKTAQRDFAASLPGDANSPANAASANPLARLQAREEWKRSHLDDGMRLEPIMQDAVHQLVSSSPLAAHLSSTQLAQLERVLASDPTMRSLLTQHLEQSLT